MRSLGPAGAVARLGVGLLLALTASGCTSGPATSADTDVIELRIAEPVASPTPPRPGDRLPWATAPLAADPEAVLTALENAFGLGFSPEPAGVHAGTRWFATTGSAVERDDVSRTTSVLVDGEDRLRSVTCSVAGPVDPGDDMLRRCAEAVGLDGQAQAWVERESQVETRELERVEQTVGAAVVQVTRRGPWEQRSQSVKVVGLPG